MKYFQNYFSSFLFLTDSWSLPLFIYSRSEHSNVCVHSSFEKQQNIDFTKRNQENLDSQKGNREFKKFTKSRKPRPSPHREICPGNHGNPGPLPIGIYCEIDFLDFKIRNHCGESNNYSHRCAQTAGINFLINEICLKQEMSFT